MATDMKAQRDYAKREYGTRNLKKASKVEMLEQGQEAKRQADRLKKQQRLLGPQGRVATASKLAALEPEQRGSTVNVLGRPGQDQAAMQAAARSAAAGGQQASQQAATGARGRASAALGQAAAKRADMQKQALGALEGAADPWGAELGKSLVTQGAGNVTQGLTGIATRGAAEGVGAEKDDALKLATAAMGIPAA